MIGSGLGRLVGRGARTGLSAAAVVGMLMASAPAHASTLTQNLTWTVDRSGTSTKYRVVAYGDSIYAGYNGSLSNVAKWLAKKCEEKGVEIYAGFSGDQLLYDGQRVAGVRLGDMGVDKHGKPKGTYQPGMDIRAKVTVLGEGVRGSLTKQLVARGRLPLLFVQERHSPAGPYPLLKETSEYALIMVESYLSGREIMRAPGQCAPPYDANNFCYREYAEVRSAIRNSASPAIPLSRLIMVEHFATNTLRFEDGQGNPRTAGWGRAYDNDPQSPTFGTPTTSAWDTAILRRTRAMKALPALAGVSSYAWGGNSSGSGSSYRIDFADTYSAIELP